MNKYKRNIYLDYLHIGIRNLNVTHGIWLLYLAAKGFSIFEIGIYEGIFHISSLSMEVPTGMVADLLSRKASRIFGIFSYLIYIALILLFENPIIIGVSFFFCGLAYTFESGSGDALVYDSLIELDEQDSFMKIQGIKEIIFQVSSSIALFVGGIIAMRALELNFIVMVFVFVTALIPILLMKETPRNINKERKNFRQLVNEHFINSTKSVFSNKKLLSLIIIGALLAAPVTTIFFYFQNHLDGLDFSVSTIGWILGVHSVFGALGGYFAHVIERKFKEKLILYIIPIFIIISIFLVQFDAILYIPFALLGFMDSIFYVVLVDYINKLIPSEQRATVLSFSSLSFSVVMIVLFPIVGLVAEFSTFYIAFLALGVLVTLSYIYLLLTLRKHKVFE